MSTDEPQSSSSLGYLTSYAGWMFLPSMATGILQSIWYRFTIRAGEPHPVQGSARYNRDKKWIYTLVIVSYLLYTINDVWVRMVDAGNFYQVLTVNESADERTIKKQFRHLSLKYHPDKYGPGSEHIFMLLKTASDVLTDPVKRFAYERFGPTVIEPDWRFCHTHADFVYRGLYKMWPNYLGSLVFLMLLSGLGKMEFGKYWRYFTLFALFFFELAVITRPYFLNIISVVRMFTGRTLLPFEINQLAHQVALSFFIALSQLGPMYIQVKPSNAEQKHEQQLQRLQVAVTQAELEARKLIGVEVAPFVNEKHEISGPLRSKFRDWLVERRLTSEPEVRDAIGRVVKSRRTPGPPQS